MAVAIAQWAKWVNTDLTIITFILTINGAKVSTYGYGKIHL